MQKTLKQQLIEKLHQEHGIYLDPCKMYTNRSRSYGVQKISWYMVDTTIQYQSFYTMRQCLKLPTKLRIGIAEKCTYIDIDFVKLSDIDIRKKSNS
jgi:hypothetical protein